MSIPKKMTAKRLLARLAVSTLLLLIVLLLLEFGTRIILNWNGLHFGTEMWKYARDIKRRSSNALMAHEHTPNSRAFLMGVPVEINSHGYRDREFSPLKDPDTYRIMVLGDSTTLGWGTKQDEVFPKVLEKMLQEKPLAGMKKQVEVLNAGVGNYNTSQEVAAFMERGIRFHPDMVILAFFLNDGEPTQEPAGGFLPRHSNLYVLAAAAWDNTLRWAGSRQDYKDYYLQLYEEDQPGWQLNRQALRDLIQVCKERQIDLRIAIIPELHKLKKAEYEFTEVHDKMRAVGKEGGVPVYDLLDAPWPDPPSTYWVTPNDAHPNAKAHKVLGEALYAALKGDRHD